MAPAQDEWGFFLRGISLVSLCYAIALAAIYGHNGIESIVLDTLCRSLF